MDDNIHKLIAEFPADERERMLAYITSHEILGNPVLEEFYIRQYASVLQLKNYDDVRKDFGADLLEWVKGLEPELQSLAWALTEALEKQVDLQLKKIVKANEMMAQALDSAVEASKAELTSKASELDRTFAEIADKERRRVKQALIDTLNAKLDPYIAKAFKSSTDRHTAKAFLRDTLVVVIGMGIFYFIKSRI